MQSAFTTAQVPALIDEDEQEIENSKNINNKVDNVMLYISLSIYIIIMMIVLYVLFVLFNKKAKINIDYYY